jgi:hypothetical protein
VTAKSGLQLGLEGILCNFMEFGHQATSISGLISLLGPGGEEREKEDWGEWDEELSVLSPFSCLTLSGV